MKVKVYEWINSENGAYIQLPGKYFYEQEVTFKVLKSPTNGKTALISGGRTEVVIPNSTLVALEGKPTTIAQRGNIFFDYDGMRTYEYIQYDTKVLRKGKNIDKRCGYGVFFSDEHPAWMVFDKEYGAVSRIVTSGELTLHLVPCLTSDNEACMIDLLSGELYRNQGSGAFSVEGECLYEFETPVIKQVMRKPSIVVRLREWLKSNREGDVINVDFPLNANTPIKANIMLDMSEQYPHNGRHFFRFDGYNYAFYGNGNEVNPIRLAVWSVNSQYNKNYVAKNGATEVEFYSDRVITEFGNYTWDASRMSMILQNHIGDAQCQDVIIGEVWQDGIFHLHPAELALPFGTHPMGTACMINLNNGDLYFNQGSGQFTCEGADFGIWTDTLYDDMRIKDVKADMVCIMNNGEPRVVYERTQPFIEHRWLTQNNTQAHCIIHDNLAQSLDIVMEMELLPYNYSTFGIANIQDFHIYATRLDTRVNSVSVSKGVVAKGGYYRYQITEDKVLHFSAPNFSTEIEDAMYKSDALLNIGLFAMTDGVDNIAVSNTNNKIRYFKLGNLHLTPVHLTRNLFPHEIASSNTALRGECGFADKEKYKRGEPWFYGNKATSGSFSVSDE